MVPSHLPLISALELQPAYLEVLNNIGVVLQEKQLYDDAAHYYRRALQLRPNYSGALTNLGDVLKDAGASDFIIRHRFR